MQSLYIRNCVNADDGMDSVDMNCIIPLKEKNEISLEISCCVAEEVLYRLNNYKQNEVQFKSKKIELVLFRVDAVEKNIVKSILKMLRTINKQIFLCIWDSSIHLNPQQRYDYFTDGASMVTNSIPDLTDVIQTITDIHTNVRGKYRCPFCDKSGLTEDNLWKHCPLYHINTQNIRWKCPICRTMAKGPFQVHLRNGHGPPSRREMISEFTMPETTLYSFALVVCYNPKINQYLLVQEFANSGFWLPGGRIDSDEDPKQAAIRETKEEAGIDIVLTGLIRMEYTPKKDHKGNCYVRMRFIFTAEPCDYDQVPKTIPDYESVGASWCSADQVNSLPLRGPEPKTYFSYLANGGIVHPLTAVVTPGDLGPRH